MFLAEGSCLQQCNALRDDTGLVGRWRCEKRISQDKEGFNLYIFDVVRESKEVCGELLSIINTQTGGTGKIVKSVDISSLSFVIRRGDVDMGFDAQIYMSISIHAPLTDTRQLQRFQCPCCHHQES